MSDSTYPEFMPPNWRNMVVDGDDRVRPRNRWWHPTDLPEWLEANVPTPAAFMLVYPRWMELLREDLTTWQAARVRMTMKRALLRLVEREAGADQAQAMLSALSVRTLPSPESPLYWMFEALLNRHFVWNVASGQELHGPSSEDVAPNGRSGWRWLLPSAEIWQTIDGEWLYVEHEQTALAV